MREKISAAGNAKPKPAPPWLASAAIGLTILGMAAGAMAIGTGIALTGTAPSDR